MTREELKNLLESTLMTKKEVLEYLDVSRQYLSRISSSKLTPFYGGLYLKDDVIEYRRTHRKDTSNK